jgi:hypothetical protein
VARGWTDLTSQRIAIAARPCGKHENAGSDKIKLPCASNLNLYWFSPCRALHCRVVKVSQMPKDLWFTGTWI